jgi:hypothetical protein
VDNFSPWSDRAEIIEMAVVLTPLPIHIPIVPRQPSNGGGALMTQVIHAIAGVLTPWAGFGYSFQP